MDATSLRQGGNELLAILPDATLCRMSQHCSRVTLEQGALVSEANQRIDFALFVESGVASVFRAAEHCSTEVALAGPEGFCGIPIVLGGETWPYRVVVQADQLTGIQIGASALRQLIASDADLRSVLLKAIQVRMVQVSEGLISGARQRVNCRLARWLLMYRDRLRSDQLPVTHEYMAAMLGVQRTGVTAALHELEGLGLISSRRGLVSIIDATELAALADGGYGVTEEHHATLFRVRPTAQISTRDDDVEVIELPLIAAEQRVPGEYERLEP